MQCKALRDSAEEIQRYDVAYFMVSVDTLEDNTAFAEENNADYPILANPEKNMVEAYGALRPNGVAHRWTFYIGADGSVLKIDKETDPETAGEDMVRTMEELGFPQI